MYKYPKEVSDYILSNYLNFEASQISDNIYNIFGLKISVGCIRAYTSKHGLIKESHHRYTKEELDWVKSNQQNYKRILDLTEAYNNVFNQSVTVLSMGALLRRFNIFKGSTKKCIGYESRLKKGGYITIKVAENRMQDKDNWKLKHRLIWEQHYGTMPEGCRIIFLDGNTCNCNISNLYCIDDSVCGYLSNHKVWKENAPLTLTLIKWAELMVVKSGRKLRNTAQLEAFNSRDNS